MITVQIGNVAVLDGAYHTAISQPEAVVVMREEGSAMAAGCVIVRVAEHPDVQGGQAVVRVEVEE